MSWTASDVILSAVIEAVPGTIPTNPAWRKMRLTSEGLRMVPQTAESGEITAARGVADSILAGVGASGSLAVELAANTVLEDFLDHLLGSDSGWTADETIPGTQLTTWTIEKHVGPFGGPDYFHRYSGVTISKARFAISPGQPITVDFDLVGGQHTADTGMVTGSTYAAASPAVNLAPVMVAHNAAFTFGGGLSGVGSAYVTAAEITIDSGNRGIQAIGVFGDAETVLGRLKITGTATVFADTDTLHAAFLAQTEGTLTVTLEDSTLTPNHHTYTLTMPRVKIDDCSVVVTGAGADLVAQIAFSALIPSGDDQITIARSTT